MTQPAPEVFVSEVDHVSRRRKRAWDACGYRNAERRARRRRKV